MLLMSKLSALDRFLIHSRPHSQSRLLTAYKTSFTTGQSPPVNVSQRGDPQEVTITTSRYPGDSHSHFLLREPHSQEAIPSRVTQGRALTRLPLVEPKRVDARWQCTQCLAFFYLNLPILVIILRASRY